MQVKNVAAECPLAGSTTRSWLCTLLSGRDEGRAMDPYPTPMTHSLCGDPQGSVSLPFPFSIHVNHKERWPKAIR